MSTSKLYIYILNLLISDHIVSDHLRFKRIMFNPRKALLKFYSIFTLLNILKVNILQSCNAFGGKYNSYFDILPILILLGISSLSDISLADS